MQLLTSNYSQSVAGSERSVLEFVEKALSALLPDETKQRQLQEQEQTSEPQRRYVTTANRLIFQFNEPNLFLRIPVFVCTTGFPGIPCPLFIYEPRYRLMVRRAIENGNRQFGIAACPEPTARYNNKY
jgi:hypothetical protein